MVTHYASKSKKSGFTLVELSIVMIIIGLLIGGILKGQELYNNAVIAKIASGFTNSEVAVESFYDMYKRNPGDMPNASDIWTGARNGNGDGFIDDESFNDPVLIEEGLVFQHLSLSGFINGNYTGMLDANGRWVPNSTGPGYDMGQGSYSLGWIGAAPNPTTWYGQSGHSFVYGKVQGRYPTGPLLSGMETRKLDQKIDDGNPTSGRLIAASGGGPSACTEPNVSPASAVAGAAEYANFTGQNCTILYVLKFRQR
ncbi:MAG: hypothetical protein DI586_01330 [Micavibrio aeruginosavorus]|uniref:Prepilin-type N-terminal cleavage/methylation domain-containing protein n=1 Tax=Micavibrio aeruginosavorus TaxID=349221 RepID=A0A2W5FQC4_9BACT|nr:MAG: hypothetical protein DI586_01330 [Micavibrio aeruginosavorus]